MITLKEYQKHTLSALERYLGLARLSSPAAAFDRVIAEMPSGAGPQQYRERLGMDDVPYVCLRLPTGGGKTLLACHAIGIAADNYLEREFPLVLWLTPTNTIRTQTADAIRDPAHPYREALDAAFGLDTVMVFDIADVANIRPKDLSQKVCIVVATMQTLRVSEKSKEFRKVYGDNENFEEHFKGLPNTAPGLDRKDNDPNKRVVYSFVNILHQLRPLVIVDEAHKAVSDLSGEMMRRINPACVVEMTATPVDSNVLYHVGASELKTEEMVKLPFMLTEHNDWEQAVNGALASHRFLVEKAKEDADYIRPLVLFQAEKKGREHTVEVLKNHLITNEGIPESRIAVATGEQRELDGINLFDKTCPIQYVITIEALKEGWDCSFAYVFCSLANISSAVDVEQLLGRVMRMPYAKKRRIPELNNAYAHVVSPSFAQAANGMYDHLRNMGFNAEEAAENLVHNSVLPGMENYEQGLFANHASPPLLITLEKRPEIESLDEDEQQNISVESRDDGKFDVRIRGDISEAAEECLVAAETKQGKERVRFHVAMHRERVKKRRPASPAESGKLLQLGQLKLWIDESPESPEEETLLIASGWSPLNGYDGLAANEFSYDENARTFVFDLDGEQLSYKASEDKVQLSLFAAPNWDELNLSRWLDQQCRQDDIRQVDMLEFCRKSVAGLLRAGKFDLNMLARAKYALAAALKMKLGRLRQAALRSGYQRCLFSSEFRVEVTFQSLHSFPEYGYAESIPAYVGRYAFQKHYYRDIRDLKASGEEFDCARILDAHPKVEYWLRNVDRQKHSFWLPLHDGKFYPDFIVKLRDGRLLVVEYKGAHLEDTPDTAEKRNIGELWAGKSGGKHLFLMAVKTDAHGQSTEQQINHVIAVQ